MRHSTSPCMQGCLTGRDVQKEDTVTFFMCSGTLGGPSHGLTRTSPLPTGEDQIHTTTGWMIQVSLATCMFSFNNSTKIHIDAPCIFF